MNETKTKTIIAGDFNAHLPELGYERYNNMGREVEALNIENHTVDLGCNEVKGSELTFRYNQGFVTDKVIYNMYN